MGEVQSRLEGDGDVGKEARTRYGMPKLDEVRTIGNFSCQNQIKSDNVRSHHHNISP